MELGYWNFKGMAESIRWLAAYLGIEITEVNPKSNEDWTAMKAEFGSPFPNLPYLVDGRFKLTESLAISDYMIKKAQREDLLGNYGIERVRIRQIEGVVDDIRRQFYMEIMVSKSDHEVLMKRLLQPDSKVQQKIKQLSDYLGDKEYFMGHITWADFFFVYAAEVDGAMCMSLGFECPFSKHSNLRRLIERIKNLPGVKELHDKRMGVEFFPSNIAPFKFLTIQEIVDQKKDIFGVYSSA